MIYVCDMYVYLHIHKKFTFKLVKINVQTKVIGAKDRKSSYIYICYLQQVLDYAMSYKIPDSNFSILKMYLPLTV